MLIFICHIMKNLKEEFFMLLGFIIGLFVGGIVGVAVMCLFQINKCREVE